MNEPKSEAAQLADILTQKERELDSIIKQLEVLQGIPSTLNREVHKIVNHLHRANREVARLQEKSANVDWYSDRIREAKQG